MTDDALVGRTLGGVYQVERRLGAGGIGAVYTALQTRTKRRYALKVLLPEMSLKPGAVERFRREGEALAALGHAGIVQIHDFDTAEDGTQFLVMDLLEGEDLSTRLERTGALDWTSAIRILEEIASALGAAHALGIIHRDLKPANIFLARRAGSAERATILDFGLAKNVAVVENVRLTATGAGLGTPLYMSPEQARGSEVDLRTDVYALGCIFYEMLTGVPPFEGPTLTAVIARILTDPPPFVSHHAPRAVPIAIDEVVRRALAKDPAARYPSAQSLVDAVRHAALGFVPSPNVAVLARTAQPVDAGRALASSEGFSATLPSLAPSSPSAPVPRAQVDSAESTRENGEPATALRYGKIAQTRVSGDLAPTGRGVVWLALAAAVAAFAAAGIGFTVYRGLQHPTDTGAHTGRTATVEPVAPSAVALPTVETDPVQLAVAGRPVVDVASGNEDGAEPSDGADGPPRAHAVPAPRPRPSALVEANRTTPGTAPAAAPDVNPGAQTALERQAEAEERIARAETPVSPVVPHVADSAMAGARRQMEVQLQRTASIIAELRAVLPMTAAVRDDARLTRRGIRPTSCAAEKRRQIQLLGRGENGTVAGVAQRLDGALEAVCQSFDDWESPPAEKRDDIRRLAATLDHAEHMASEVSTTNQPRADAERVVAAVVDARRIFLRVPADGARFPCRDPIWSSFRELTLLDNHWATTAARQVLTSVDRICPSSGMSARGLDSFGQRLDTAASGGEEVLRSTMTTHEELAARFRAQASGYGSP